MASILNVDQINNAAGTSAVTIDATTGKPSFPNGAVLPAGSMIQVQTNYGTGGQGTTSTSYVDLNVSVTITPKYSNSLLIVQFFATAYVSGDAGKFSISRDGTLIGNGAGNTIAQMHPNASSNPDYQPSALTTYTTSGSTSSTTFRVSVHNDGGSTYFPAGSADQWTAYAWEIAQ